MDTILMGRVGLGQRMTHVQLCIVIIIVVVVTVIVGFFPQCSKNNFLMGYTQQCTGPIGLSDRYWAITGTIYAG